MVSSKNTPVFFTNFINIIELIRLIIQLYEWILSIRLSANLISGHLILTLFLLEIFIRNFISIIAIILLI